MSNCRGKCCLYGADVDLGEQDRILKNADLIRRLMDESQDHDAANWFENPFKDADFPSGQAITTRRHNDACVFLNREGRCVLQIAESEIGDLKPFFCRAYPLCIDAGSLTIDDENCPEEVRCCGVVGNGTLTIFDVCAFELEYVLGEDGLNELRKLASEAEESSTQPAVALSSNILEQSEV
jgi:Fe-S-cluster containining protein